MSSEKVKIAHHRCPKCKNIYAYRLQRHAAVRYLFFYIPLRRYYCGKCLTSRYVWSSD